MTETRPNRLGEAREDRGGTRQEAADQLARLAWLRLRKRVGVNANMVAKWEAGTKHPNPLYRELLYLLYRATPEYLGIGRTPAGKTRLSPPLPPSPIMSLPPPPERIRLGGL